VRQVAAAGFEESPRRHLTDARRWERVTNRLVRLVGTPETTAQRAMAAVLDAGVEAALRGRSAGAWWDIPGNVLEPFDVARLRCHARKCRGDGRHDPLLLPAHHIRVLDGVPVVTPARALFDIAGTQRRGAALPWWVERMERMTDAAWSDRLVSGAILHAMLGELAQRGRPGVGVMRQVLAERPRPHTPPASGLEARFEQILRAAGEQPMRRQVDLGDDERWIGRVDFRDPTRPLVVEIQSERFHTSLSSTSWDKQRRAAMVQAGLTVRELTDQDIWLRPRSLVTVVRGDRRMLDQLSA
jgi:hypothetical protein